MTSGPTPTRSPAPVPTLRRCACALVSAGTLAAGAPVLGTPQAAAAPARQQHTYGCEVINVDMPDQPAHVDVTTALQTDAPDQVRPGETITLTGTFSVQLPESIRGLFAAYFPSAQVVSDDLTVPVTVGGQTTVLAMSRFDTGVVSTTVNPLVFSGTVSSDPFTVPDGASGDLIVGMPADNSVPARVGSGDAAFNATLYAKGGLVPGYDEGTDEISCTAGGAPAPMATVPIIARGSGASAAPPPAAAAQTQGSGGAGGGAPAAGTAPEGSPAPAPGTPPPQAPAPPGAAAGAANAAPRPDDAQYTGLYSAPAAAQEGASDSGIRIPLRWIGWGTAAVVIVSGLFTAWSEYRLHRLRELLDG